MARQGRSDSDHASQVEAVALLAAWCECGNSLAPPPSAESFLAANPRARQLCEVVARSWDPSEPAAPTLLEHVQALQQQPGSDDSQQPQRPHLTPAEISQRSVDLLLREYYRMMQAQHATQQQRPASGGSGLVQRLFLLLCPAGPEWLELQSLAAAAAWLVCGAASLIVWCACLLVPAWLVAIRQLLLQQQHGQAAWLACAGLLLLLAADSIHRASVARRRAAAAATVTPASLKACREANSSSSSSGGVVGAGNAQLLGLHRTPRPAAGVSPNQQQQQQSAAAAGITAAPSGGRGGNNNSSSGGPSSSTGSTPSYLALLPEVLRVQAALGVSKSEALTSRELLAVELTRLCHVVGMSVTSDMLASPAAMQATLARLRQSIGLA